MKARDGLLKTLWVHGIPWKIVFRSVVLYEGKKVHGLSEATNAVMYLACEYPEEIVRSTLFHEVKHAIVGTKDHPSDEEDCIRMQEEGEWAVYHDPRNKWAARFLFEPMVE